jgi:hypothetical protein
MNQQIEMLERAGKLLSALDEHLVFVGGATISLYLDDASVEDDLVVHIALSNARNPALPLNGRANGHKACG